MLNRSGPKPPVRCVYLLFLMLILKGPGPATLPAHAVSGPETAAVTAAPNEAVKAPIRREILVVAKRGKEKAIHKWQPTADYLTRHIPGNAFVVVPYDWDEIRRAVAEGVGDFVLTNPGMYVEFEARHDVRRIATLKNLRMGAPYTAFGVVFFKRADRSDITAVDTLKGKRLAAVNETAWGGWQVAWRQLLKLGIDPYKDLENLIFSGSHDNAVLAVRDGKADIGSVRTDTLERMASEGAIDIREFQPLFLNPSYGAQFPFWLSTDLYPEWPFATASHTAMELNEKVAVALMSIPPDSRAATAGRYQGWTVPSNYQPVHETLRVLKVTPYERYGEITLPKVMAKYWKELVFALILMAGLGFASFYFRQLNRRLTKTQSQLHDELSERVKAQKKLQKASEEVREKNKELEENLSRIKTMQDQIIMQEKMASLGSLTAGIAHEIKNPLNFVINFSELTVDLAGELNEEMEDHREKFNDDTWSYLQEILGDLSTNASKINAHGKRSDAIVRNMLNHSRGNTGERIMTEMNTFVDEYVKLGYHGMRANDSGFNVTIHTDYDPELGLMEITPQDMSRVILNLVNNACYAVRERQHSEKQRRGDGDEPYDPCLWIRTRKLAGGMELAIRDNGTGMPDEVREKVFTPFFTTKPTGSGTGLGLSMSYDIVVQGHGGKFNVDSRAGEFTCFTLELPGTVG